jgi:hypothetical protein
MGFMHLYTYTLSCFWLATFGPYMAYGIKDTYVVCFYVCM